MTHLGALAVPHRSANAIGPVRLALDMEGLRIDLLSVGRFAVGFAFVGLSDMVTMRVPYAAVRAMVRDGRVLHLVLDERAAAPYTRFALVRFSQEPDDELLKVFRVRGWLAALGYALPLPLAALSAWLVPRPLVGGPLGVAALATVVAWACFTFLRRWLEEVSSGGPESERLRTAFEHRLSERLGLEPAVELPALGGAPTVKEALAAVSRPKLLALAGTLAATGVIAMGVVVQRYGIADRVVLPVGAARAGLAEPARTRMAAAVAVGTPDRPACGCRQVDAPMWREGMPQLAVMVTPIKGRIGATWLDKGRTYPVAFDEPAVAGVQRRVELDLAVVNNSRLTLDTVDLVVTFARRDDQGRRRVVTERGLHWPGKLAPGEAVKWRVRAPGTELKVDSRLDARLAPGNGELQVAPADTFHHLRRARLPAVRLHGAMMLAYLRDPRATTMLDGLELGRDLEDARSAVRQTLVPLQVCDATAGGGKLTACVFNGSTTLRREIRLRDPASAKAWGIADLFVPGRGLRVEIDLEGKPRPERLVVE